MNRPTLLDTCPPECECSAHPHPATRMFEQPYEEARCDRCGGTVGFHHECRENHQSREGTSE